MEEENPTSKVLIKLKELRVKHKKPISLKMLVEEFANVYTQVEIKEEIEKLNEMAEIRLISGPEPCYDLY